MCATIEKLRMYFGSTAILVPGGGSVTEGTEDIRSRTPLCSRRLCLGVSEAGTTGCADETGVTTEFSVGNTGLGGGNGEGHLLDIGADVVEEFLPGGDH